MEKSTTVEKSRLQQLLEKNSSTGLTREEESEAVGLINNPDFSEKNCWVCKMACSDDIKKAIFDTDLCQGHATYVLNTQK